MSDIAIKVENLSKQYRLGAVGTKTIAEDLNRFWARIRGKEDPYAMVGQANDRSKKADSDYVWSLKDVNFEIKKGEAVGIIGRNGAGKSTLLKILSRVTTPTAGKVHINGRVASLLEVGTGFHGDLTGRENIYMNGAILGMSRSEITTKLDEIIDFSGVSGYIDTPVKRYSSGMYVRLAFAVAAHLEPEILIVDEVLAVGDAEFQKKCLGKMQDVNSKEGRTVLFVSHQMGAVRDLCSRAIMLKNGQIYQDGNVKDVISEYLETNLTLSNRTVGERIDRQGVGHVKIESINFINPTTNRVLDTILSGENLCIEIGYKTYSNDDYLSNVVFGLSIFTKDEQFLTPLNNKMVKEAFGTLAREGKVQCYVPNLPLMSGKFYINCGLSVNNTLQDLVEKAIDFTVLEGDYFRSGTSNVNNRQGIYIPHSWSSKL